MRVRPAVPEDVPSLANIHISSWRSTYRGLLPDELLENLSVENRETMWQQQVAIVRRDPSRGCVWIAEIEPGDAIGFASGGPEREADSSFDGELYAIYLHHEHQRRGIGRLLLGFVAEHLRTHDFASMRAWVMKGNPAQGFYERLGGQRVGEKETSMGGVSFIEVAYGWRNLDTLGTSK